MNKYFQVKFLKFLVFCSFLNRLIVVLGCPNTRAKYIINCSYVNIKLNAKDQCSLHVL